MTIPWDTDRPLWIPEVGEGIDAETAALLLARYLPDVRAMLTEIEAQVAARSSGKLWVKAWDADAIVRNWGSGTLDAILLGFVMTDERASGGTFRSVLVLIEKETGELETRDHSRLLSG